MPQAQQGLYGGRKKCKSGKLSDYQLIVKSETFDKRKVGSWSHYVPSSALELNGMELGTDIPMPL
jgi:hypothetical protein